MIVGKIIYPESANLLEHYLDGTGKNLYLEADYFRKSPVVRKNLNSMRVNETKEVRFKQHEDWRLSYALNPFYLKKGRKMIKIYQEIEFSTKKGVYTNLNFYFFKVRLPDRLVHVLKPKPFMVYISWNVDQ
ncbi:hypothetical protein I5M27_02715 [Adhaeribacter sp. BT258]|uniref:Uncharacterized protein n=1 Tax=Adhaeribacter terrigena TaxID=2793070 RepID=A0ABS1BXU3_9BACT|nr:hypothetical protein [Adhaeribacter terrigena]